MVLITFELSNSLISLMYRHGQLNFKFGKIYQHVKFVTRLSNFKIPMISGNERFFLSGETKIKNIGFEM